VARRVDVELVPLEVIALRVALKREVHDRIERSLAALLEQEQVVDLTTVTEIRRDVSEAGRIVAEQRGGTRRFADAEHELDARMIEQGPQYRAGNAPVRARDEHAPASDPRGTGK